MPAPSIEDLEATVQQLIEARVPRGNWKHASGRVQPSPTGVGTFRDHRVETVNPRASEPLEKWFDVQSAIDVLLRRKGAKWCTYYLEPEGTIDFEYTK